MTVSELKERLECGIEEYASVYSDTEKARERILAAVDGFASLYGEDRDIIVISAPGRTEISGNHTDHQNGRVIAASVDRDIIAVAAKSDNGKIRIYSDGYAEEKVTLKEKMLPEKFKKYTSAALIAGVAQGLSDKGFEVGGFDAYMTSEVLQGAGISSSAAYEVAVGTVFNHLYNGGNIDSKEIAKVAQFAENVFFGKPCGLMDQMACAVGGVVYIDFENPEEPLIEPMPISLSDYGYSICLVNSGASHADLNDDYASVPSEMKAVAKLLGRDVLRSLTEEDILKNITNIRRIVGDRAVLRALHFLRENGRVLNVFEALKRKDIKSFLEGINESGRSSFEYLQNIYSPSNVKEQPIALALAVTDGFLTGSRFAMRVHGGGFAGTVQVFLKNELVEEYAEHINSVFGDGSAHVMKIRPLGAARLY